MKASLNTPVNADCAIANRTLKMLNLIVCRAWDLQLTQKIHLCMHLTVQWWQSRLKSLMTGAHPHDTSGRT